MTRFGCSPGGVAGSHATVDARPHPVALNSCRVQPLHYRPAEDWQFILYSVGWNEKDDGGTVSLTKGGSVDMDNGDWVWRYPGLPKP